ncbi:class Ib ribonucleoside-diphosphate reductase assembly flavoprotein NrdI [Salicibibacter cibarius]|uniref:Class Ib ribonucleoside-diphosphate reductase assembly flavoprotein NrdI n=1 Tax=Salicibibacter cibarius TaxID=2743000 RepID=A0A7T6Z765_9BACI|nr:class Ib ribonucleoside-diphosphate reductase assembly flavoprotein NrdI [Salicibibacter cibarius]QQK78036.1 class Ib ribonucleoside-diphosphate reductase assembly flavoprotein NrdI [Salicibibacter cibarius]
MAPRNALILYESLSGNTAQLSMFIQQMLEYDGVDAERMPLRSFLDLSIADAEAMIGPYGTILIGTYTDDAHLPPEPIEELMETYAFPDKQIAAFGTGDTQWGETYCLAAHTVAKHYQSPYPVLEIEQMPARSDEEKIDHWLEAIDDEQTHGKSSDYGTGKSGAVHRHH